jgi:hypothetical protein
MSRHTPSAVAATITNPPDRLLRVATRPGPMTGLAAGEAGAILVSSANPASPITHR